MMRKTDGRRQGLRLGRADCCDAKEETGPVSPGRLRGNSWLPNLWLRPLLTYQLALLGCERRRRVSVTLQAVRSPAGSVAGKLTVLAPQGLVSLSNLPQLDALLGGQNL